MKVPELELLEALLAAWPLGWCSSSAMSVGRLLLPERPFFLGIARAVLRNSRKEVLPLLRAPMMTIL
jgi:hypothetical protein